MMSHNDSSSSSSPLGKALGAVVASVCVAGFVGLIWLNTHVPADSTGSVTASPTSFAGVSPPIVDAAAAESGATPSPRSLHAPTSDPSLPSLDATVSKARDPAEADEPVPTF